MQTNDEAVRTISCAIEYAVSPAPVALRALLIASPSDNTIPATRLAIRVLAALDDAGWDVDSDTAVTAIVSGFAMASPAQMADLAAGDGRATAAVAEFVAIELTLQSATLARRNLVG